MADKGPLDDVEVAYLYAVCKADSETAYQYIRRLHRHGVIPDPPYVDELPRITFASATSPIANSLSYSSVTSGETEP